MVPIKINDLDNGRGNIIVGTGGITGEEYCDVMEKHLSQPIDKLKKYIYSIVDISEASYVTVSLEDIRIIAAKSLEVAKLNPDVTIGISVNEEISSLLAEMWELLVDESSWNVNIFRSREELDQWLSQSLSKKHKKLKLSFS
jgi:hypothetical protein